MAILRVCVFIAVLTCCHCQVSTGMYRIENKENNLHLTTEGANAAFARVVGENWQNFGEQRWAVEGSNGAYTLMPQKYTINNVLSYYRDPTKKHALPEKWNLLKVGEGYYQIQNSRTSQCLISGGRRKEIAEGKCDTYLPDRQWRFIPL